MSVHVKREWYKEETPVKEYEYSFALIGDTQMLSMLDADTGTASKADSDIPNEWIGQSLMKTLYGWIADNKDSKKIAHAFILGDITENIAVEAEWKTARKAISLIDGRVDFSAVRGNHDHPQNYNDMIDRLEYKNTVEGFYEPKRWRNAYKRFEVGGVKYLSLMLDHGVPDEIIEWADGIISQFPDHKVIVSTHTYIDQKGDFITHESNGRATPIKNDGVAIWEELLSKHKNVFMVFCGHCGVWGGYSSSVVVGDNGNRVINVMTDPEVIDLHGDFPGAMVLMLYFAKDGKSVDVRYYSTARDEFYGEGRTIEL